MTTIHQLNPPFHLWIPEVQDHGLALFLIDYHVEEHLYWVCAMEKTGEIWTLSNDKVRADVNRSIGRVYAKHTGRWSSGDGVNLSNVPREAVYEEDTELRGASQFQPIGGTKEFKVPSSLRVCEPKVHLNVPGASTAGARQEQGVYTGRETVSSSGDSKAERAAHRALTEAVRRVYEANPNTRSKIPVRFRTVVENTRRQRKDKEKGSRRTKSRKD